MCKYCEKDKRKRRNSIINSPTLFLQIKNNQGIEFLYIKHYNSKADIIEDAKAIKFCPMCGRELGGNTK